MTLSLAGEIESRAELAAPPRPGRTELAARMSPLPPGPGEQSVAPCCCANVSAIKMYQVQDEINISTHKNRKTAKGSHLASP